jgi:hypothetical protein
MIPRSGHRVSDQITRKKDQRTMPGIMRQTEES